MFQNALSLEEKKIEELYTSMKTEITQLSSYYVKYIYKSIIFNWNKQVKATCYDPFHHCIFILWNLLK